VDATRMTLKIGGNNFSRLFFIMISFLANKH
jgi:hypothetical protein